MSPLLIRYARDGLLLAGIFLLAGCVYDPYTGAYYPCCSTPYPYYGTPTYPPYQGYPYGYRPPYYPPSDYPRQPYGNVPPAAGPAAMPGEAAVAQQFAAANVTHDGRLTLQQAEAANWQAVARNFPDIDIDRKGYVTLNEIRVWLETRRPPPSGATG